ncbi:MAG: ACT domain-containing protein, partial [Candidatus Latescibacteria bacterium]|nr:ACT domain-containing protein [Candidatus Latescibacterota bacterium]
IRIRPIAELETKYYLRLIVADRPGVFARIARVLGDADISIASVIQKERDLEGGSVPLVIVTHEAKEAAMQRALGAIDALDAVPDGVKLIRMEEL